MPKDSPEKAEAVTTPRRKSRRSGSDGVWNHAALAVIVSTIGLAAAALILLWQLVISANEAHQQQQASHLEVMQALLADNGELGWAENADGLTSADLADDPLLEELAADELYMKDTHRNP